MRRIALLALCAAGFGTAAAQEPWPSFGSPAHFTEVSGAGLYGSVCASCHMPQGQGAAGAGAYPALAGDPRLASSRYVITRVLHGHGAMPGFSRFLSDAQVAELVAYVQSRFGVMPAPAPDPAGVAALR